MRFEGVATRERGTLRRIGRLVSKWSIGLGRALEVAGRLEGNEKP